MTKRIGIYTGTFDPIHAGHIAFGEQAVHECKLHSVVFIPEKAPRNKPLASSTSQRLAGIRSATTDSTLFQATTLTSEQFTVAQTLPELQCLYPNTKLTFLFGSDIIRTFGDKWLHLERLLATSDLAIGLRGSDTVSDIERIIEQLEHTYDIQIQRTYIRTSHAHVSSSQIRHHALTKQKTP